MQHQQLLKKKKSCSSIKTVIPTRVQILTEAPLIP